MSEHELELILGSQFLLKDGITSPEVLLHDATGEGDMFFTFTIKHVDQDNVETSVSIIDKFHAAFTIETKPDALIRPDEPIKIGTYSDKEYPLYVTFAVFPQITNTGEHNVSVSFLIRREG